VARLTARSDEIAAARADIQVARAALAQAQWRLGQKAVPAPVAGTVQDRLYLPGEFVPAGNPVVTLLPPENLKLRFFVGKPNSPGSGWARRSRPAVTAAAKRLRRASASSPPRRNTRRGDL